MASKKLEEALDKLNQPVLQIAELEKQIKEAKVFGVVDHCYSS